MINLKQKRVYDFIRGYCASNSEPPTLAEIGNHFQFKSSATVHAVLAILEREGLIKKTPNVARGITLVGQPSESEMVM